MLGRDKPGVVLVIASIAGLNGVYPAASYSASKHAVVGFVKSMQMLDPEEGVKVVGICPG